MSINLMRLFPPCSTTNNLVPKEEERNRIEFGLPNKAERSGPSWYPKEEQTPAKVETMEEVRLICLIQLFAESAT